MTQMNLTLASNGRVLIPAEIRAELGLVGGDKLVARLVDGALMLEPIQTAVRRAQRMVAQYVPSGTPLVAELMTERKAASERE